MSLLKATSASIVCYRIYIRVLRGRVLNWEERHNTSEGVVVKKQTDGLMSFVVDLTGNFGELIELADH
jgi:hypothetical protein